MQIPGHAAPLHFTGMEVLVVKVAAPQALRAPICADREVRAHFSPNEAVQSLVEHCDRVRQPPFDIVCAHAAAIGASALPAAAFVEAVPNVFSPAPAFIPRAAPPSSTAPPPTAAVSVLHEDWRHSGPSPVGTTKQ